MLSGKTKKIISAVLLFSIIFANLVVPQPVYGFNLFRELFKGVKKSTRFVLQLPDKATRWMGPVLGPIAADILTQNLVRKPHIAKLFKRARQANKTIQTIEEQNKLLAETQKMYRDEAEYLDSQADKIRETRKEMAAQVTKGEMSYDDFKDKVVSLEQMAQIYDKAALRFRNAADNMKPGDMVKMVGRIAMQELMGQIRDAVIFEATAELDKLIDPNIINTLLSGKTSFDNLLDILIASDIDRELQGRSGEFDLDELKKRVRERIKEVLKENRNALKENWREMVEQIIKEKTDELAKEKRELPKLPADQKKDQKDESLTLEELLEIDGEGTSGKCPAGWIWDNKVGKCKQENCNDVENAHWSYTVDCVCGSSGAVNENPKDPNKECAYPKTYKSCPGCVYACVDLDEDCPLEGIGL